MHKKAIRLFLSQEIARNKGAGEEDLCTLDVHAIDELKTKAFPPTVDASKYEYEKGDNNTYGIPKIPCDIVLTLRRIFAPGDRAKPFELVKVRSTVRIMQVS